ncbi:extensin family protein [Sphingomonas sabuli]|uniref:Extensin family protein n=1 Tax=Sphingomonas sabuli TaxID=2764186 RepID=A0A7G9L3G6_9SPHN|nr:extensin family protein [Sphingomonas sabuli]QNM83165.1 extensin family protein [Sphingomonas sabuli]
MGRIGCLLLFLAVFGGLWLAGRNYLRQHPQDVPWTQLRLNDPVGRFTAQKIAALGETPAQCRRLLADAGLSIAAADPRRSSNLACGYEDGMRLDGDFRPAGLVTSCPVAAALALWQERVVQPAARRHFGERVAELRHAGSFSCRRLYGRDEGRWSEHATADAVDVTGFRLAGGDDVSVLADWDDPGAKAAFLRDVRDGACPLFSTVLSPDYNDAHADHFHLDTANRGGGGWTLCR